MQKIKETIIEYYLEMNRIFLGLVSVFCVVVTIDVLIFGYIYFYILKPNYAWGIRRLDSPLEDVFNQVNADAMKHQN